jgi:prolyl oligopeptidase PreP (S9A serine peptidase family)
MIADVPVSFYLSGGLDSSLVACIAGKLYGTGLNTFSLTFDDRVFPGHSFKYAAALQAAQSKNPGCTNPVLIRIETRAGHGAGKPTSKRIEEAADQWAFLVKSLKMNPTIPGAGESTTGRSGR